MRLEIFEYSLTTMKRRLALLAVFFITLLPSTISLVQSQSSFLSSDFSLNCPDFLLENRARSKVHVQYFSVRDQEYPSVSRRGALGLGILATFIAANRPRAAVANNPLNLKGTYWETGKLYKKSDTELPSDPDELLTSLIQAAAALGSLTDVAVDGKFEDLSRLLRGGAVSESRIRLRAYALIDMIENEDKEYLASDLFRTFLRDFDALDGMVEAAVRQAKMDGGFTETLGLAVISPLSASNDLRRLTSEPSLGKDPRINVLATLGEATKALQAFNKHTGDTIRSQ